MITRDQCRAARGLLEWKQIDLADRCGVSKTAITNFESGAINPRGDTVEMIQAALEKGGVEFVGDYGVQKRQNFFKVLDGDNAMPQVWDDIFETMKNQGGGEICIANVDERAAYLQHPEKLSAHIQRLKDHKITERLLIREKDSFFIQPPECYRWVSKESFHAGMTTYLYGGKIAMRFWKKSLILIISHPAIYEEEQARFNYLWDNAIIPSYDELAIEGPEKIDHK